MFDNYQLVEGQKVSFTPNYATSKVGLLGSNGPEVPGWKAELLYTYLSQNPFSIANFCYISDCFMVFQIACGNICKVANVSPL
jgi:hypothetical protein